MSSACLLPSNIELAQCISDLHNSNILSTVLGKEHFGHVEPFLSHIDALIVEESLKHPQQSAGEKTANSDSEQADSSRDLEISANKESQSSKSSVSEINCTPPAKHLDMLVQLLHGCVPDSREPSAASPKGSRRENVSGQDEAAPADAECGDKGSSRDSMEEDDNDKSQTNQSADDNEKQKETSLNGDQLQSKQHGTDNAGVKEPSPAKKSSDGASESGNQSSGTGQSQAAAGTSAAATSSNNDSSKHEKDCGTNSNAKTVDDQGKRSRKWAPVAADLEIALPLHVSYDSNFSSIPVQPSTSFNKSSTARQYPSASVLPESTLLALRKCAMEVWFAKNNEIPLPLVDMRHLAREESLADSRGAQRFATLMQPGQAAPTAIKPPPSSHTPLASLGTGAVSAASSPRPDVPVSSASAVKPTSFAAGSAANAPKVFAPTASAPLHRSTSAPTSAKVAPLTFMPMVGFGAGIGMGMPMSGYGGMQAPQKPLPSELSLRITKGLDRFAYALSRASGNSFALKIAIVQKSLDVHGVHFVMSIMRQWASAPSRKAHLEQLVTFCTESMAALNDERKAAKPPSDAKARLHVLRVALQSIGSVGLQGSNVIRDSEKIGRTADDIFGTPIPVAFPQPKTRHIVDFGSFSGSGIDRKDPLGKASLHRLALTGGHESATVVKDQICHKFLRTLISAELQAVRVMLADAGVIDALVRIVTEFCVGKLANQMLKLVESTGSSPAQMRQLLSYVFKPWMQAVVTNIPNIVSGPGALAGGCVGLRLRSQLRYLASKSEKLKNDGSECEGAGAAPTIAFSSSSASDSSATKETLNQETMEEDSISSAPKPFGDLTAETLLSLLHEHFEFPNDEDASRFQDGMEEDNEDQISDFEVDDSPCSHLEKGAKKLQTASDQTALKALEDERKTLSQIKELEFKKVEKPPPTPSVASTILPPGIHSNFQQQYVPTSGTYVPTSLPVSGSLPASQFAYVAPAGHQTMPGAVVSTPGAASPRSSVPLTTTYVSGIPPTSLPYRTVPYNPMSSSAIGSPGSGTPFYPPTSSTALSSRPVSTTQQIHKQGQQPYTVPVRTSSGPGNPAAIPPPSTTQYRPGLPLTSSSTQLSGTVPGIPIQRSAVSQATGSNIRTVGNNSNVPMTRIQPSVASPAAGVSGAGSPRPLPSTTAPGTMYTVPSGSTTARSPIVASGQISAPSGVGKSSTGLPSHLPTPQTQGQAYNTPMAVGASVQVSTLPTTAASAAMATNVLNYSSQPVPTSSVPKVGPGVQQPVQGGVQVPPAQSPAQTGSSTTVLPTTRTLLPAVSSQLSQKPPGTLASTAPLPITSTTSSQVGQALRPMAGSPSSSAASQPAPQPQAGKLSAPQNASSQILPAAASATIASKAILTNTSPAAQNPLPSPAVPKAAPQPSAVVAATLASNPTLKSSAILPSSGSTRPSAISSTATSAPLTMGSASQPSNQSNKPGTPGSMSSPAPPINHSMNASGSLANKSNAAQVLGSSKGTDTQPSVSLNATAPQQTSASIPSSRQQESLSTTSTSGNPPPVPKAAAIAPSTNPSAAKDNNTAQAQGGIIGQVSPSSKPGGQKHNVQPSAEQISSEDEDADAVVPVGEEPSANASGKKIVSNSGDSPKDTGARSSRSSRSSRGKSNSIAADEGKPKAQPAAEESAGEEEIDEPRTRRSTRASAAAAAPAGAKSSLGTKRERENRPDDSEAEEVPATRRQSRRLRR